MQIKTENKVPSLGIEVLQVYTHKNKVFMKQEASEATKTKVASWFPIAFYWKPR